ncbi:MAG: DUF4209 domain-containing protein [Candidatus Ancaeobacter aquaticus]|nr:DUF4209 domain-containing protein [Candidatus Ancaeobacter aquaticus]
MLDKRLLENFEEAIADVKSKKFPNLLSAFEQRRNAAKETGDGELEISMSLLWRVFSMYFIFEKGKPFGPLMTSSQGRTLIPEDLKEDELSKLEEIVKVSTNSQFVARIYDVLWIRGRNYLHAQKAVKAYLQSADEDKNNEMWVQRSEWLKRATQMAMELGEKAQERQIVSKKILSLFEESRKTCFNAKQDYWPSSLLELLIENKLIDNWKNLGDKVVEIAKGFPMSPGCDAPHRYYEHAAKCYSYANDSEKAREMKIAIAKHWEDEARSFKTPQGCDGSNLAYRLEKAIHAYRAAGEKMKAEDLVHELKEANKLTISQMKVISSPHIDAAPLIKIADDLLEGKAGKGAIAAFAALYKPFSYEQERETAEKNLKEHPLQGLFDTHILTEEGNVSAKIGGMSDEHETTLNAQIIRSYNLGQNLSACTTLKRGIYLILQSGDSWKEAIKELIGKSKFVPEERRDIFERAIIAGFESDFLIFTHLIVPQIENSIRLIFAINKLKTTSVSPEGVQEERDLNQLLNNSNAEEIFSKDLVWEMRSLFIEKCGPNLRNRVCHGLIDSKDINSSSSFFLLWLIVHLLIGFSKNDDV